MVSFDSIKGMVKLIAIHLFNPLFWNRSYCNSIYIYLTLKKHGYKNVTLSWYLFKLLKHKPVIFCTDNKIKSA